MMFIMDTDTFSLLGRGHPRIVDRNQREPDKVALTVVTQIEVLQGRFASVIKASTGGLLLRDQEWLEQSERELANIPLLPFDVPAAAVFDRLRLDRKLRKIGRADLLIAAIALAHRATVATRNVRDFQQVPGLRVENWAD
jgi:tRNA(fMet)-specific endonuclease VapC